MHVTLDLSSYQHPGSDAIDYEQVFAWAKGITDGTGLDQPLAVIKLTEKSPNGNYVNPYAAADIEGFRKAGFAVAGYVFFHPAVDVDAQIQLALANRYEVDVILVDSEVTTELPVAETGQTTHDMLDGLSWHLIHTGLYADLSNVQAWTGAPWDYPLFLAEYGVDKPSLPCAAWQNGNTDPVPGISGAVDHDIWYGQPEPTPNDGLWNLWFNPQPPLPTPDPGKPTDYQGAPTPADAIGFWHIAQVPGAEAAFYLVNFVEGSGIRHTFDSNNSGLIQDYRRAGFPTIDISIQVAQSLREVPVG